MADREIKFGKKILFQNQFKVISGHFRQIKYFGYEKEKKNWFTSTLGVRFPN